MRFNRHSERGSSLMSFIVMAGFLSILAAGLLRQIDFNFKAEAKIADDVKLMAKDIYWAQVVADDELCAYTEITKGMLGQWLSTDPGGGKGKGKGKKLKTVGKKVSYTIGGQSKDFWTAGKKGKYIYVLNYDVYQPYPPIFTKAFDGTVTTRIQTDLYEIGYRKEKPSDPPQPYEAVATSFYLEVDGNPASPDFGDLIACYGPVSSRSACIDSGGRWNTDPLLGPKCITN